MYLVQHTEFINVNNAVWIWCNEATIEILYCSLYSCHSSGSSPMQVNTKRGCISLTSTKAHDCISDKYSHFILVETSGQGNFVNANRISAVECGVEEVSTCVCFLGESITCNSNYSDNKALWESAIKQTSQDYTFQTTLAYSNVINCSTSGTVIFSAYGILNIIRCMNAVSCGQGSKEASVCISINDLYIFHSNFISNTCSYDISANKAIIEKCYLNPSKISGGISFQTITTATNINVAGIPKVRLVTQKFSTRLHWCFSIDFIYIFR